MKYVINVRPLSLADASRDCNFPDTNLDNYQAHLDALVEDTRSLSVVRSIEKIENSLKIDSELNEYDLLLSMKPFFSREFCHVRFVNLEKIT